MLSFIPFNISSDLFCHWRETLLCLSYRMRHKVIPIVRRLCTTPGMDLHRIERNGQLPPPSLFGASSLYKQCIGATVWLLYILIRKSPVLNYFSTAGNDRLPYHLPRIYTHWATFSLWLNHVSIWFTFNQFKKKKTKNENCAYFV